MSCSALHFTTLATQLTFAPRLMIRVCRSRHAARLQGDKKGRFCGDRKLTSPRRETNSTNVGGKKVRTLRLGAERRPYKKPSGRNTTVAL